MKLLVFVWSWFFLFKKIVVCYFLIFSPSVRSEMFEDVFLLLFGVTTKFRGGEVLEVSNF